MKNTLFIALLGVLPFLSQAQESASKQKEVGLTFSSLNNFGLTFRTGSEKALWRFQTLIGTGNNQSEQLANGEEVRNQFNTAIGIGREMRKPVTDKLTARYGVDVAFNHNSFSIETTDLQGDLTALDETTQNGFGANLVLGFNYALSDNLLLGAELLPHVTFYKDTQKSLDPVTSEIDETDIDRVSYGMSNQSARLSLVYVIRK